MQLLLRNLDVDVLRHTLKKISVILCVYTVCKQVHMYDSRQRRSQRNCVLDAITQTCTHSPRVVVVVSTEKQ